MPSSNYPTSLETSAQQPTPASTTDLDASGYEHDQVHGAASTALIALETKLGISNTPAASASANSVLMNGGSPGTTSWSNTITGSTIAGTTLSGAVTGGDQVMSAVTHKDYAETCAENAASGTAATIDMNDGNVHHVQLTGNCTFTFSNPVATGDSSSFTLILEQDGTGSRTATWPASVKWAAATAPTLTTTADKFDVLAFTTVDGGTRWFGFVAGQDFA